MTAHAPARKPRGFKIALIVIAALFLLFVAFICLLPYFLPVGTIKSIANSQASEYGLHVDFSKLGFSWNGSVVLDDIAVSPLKSDGTPDSPIATVGEVSTNVSLPSLISGKIVVNSVSVANVKANIVRRADGSLNLPDFAKAGASAPTTAPATRETGSGRDSSPQAESQGFSLPAILGTLELHRLDVKNAVLSLDDQAGGIQADVALDTFRLEGGGLNDPFVFSGRLLPFPGSPDKGEFPFTGRAAMIKDFALNPDGEATFEVSVNNFSLADLAAKLGLADTLPSGKAGGQVKAAYANRQGLLSVADMKLSDARVGLGESHIAVPETTVGMNAAFLPESGAINLTDLSLVNAIATLRGRGVVEDVPALLKGGMPAAVVDFSGAADFVKAGDFAETLGVALPVRPDGRADFAGKITLPRRESPDAPLAPTFSVDFGDGDVAVKEPKSGIDAKLNLKGLGVRAAAVLAAPVRVTASVALADVPANLAVPQLSSIPVATRLNGGIALTAAGETTAIELRLRDTRASIPATPWSEALDVVVPETTVTYDLAKDLANIQNLRFTAGDGIQGGISQGAVSGILAGNPAGQAIVNCAAPVEKLKALLGPAMPPQIDGLAGAAQASAHIKMANNVVEATVNAEIDNASISLNIEPGASQAAVGSPKAAASFVVGLNLGNLEAINLASLDAQFEGATLRFADRSGLSVNGQLAAGRAQAAGSVDLASLTGNFTNLQAAVGGMAVALGQNGQQVAGLSSGVIRAGAAAGDAPLAVPVSGKGDFSLAALNATVDNLVFYRLQGEQREESRFGNLSAKLAANGYVGDAKPQVVTVSAASLSATPVIVNSQAKIDLDRLAFAANYATRVNPAGLASLFSYLNLPPAILADLAASGSISFDGRKVEAKGQTQGQLRVASGELNPFAAAHDVAATYNTDERSLTVDVNRLEGLVRTGAGEAAATLEAEKSTLFLSRAASRGGINIRVNGSAGPTRMLALGLVGMIPQLRDVGNALHNAQATGTYTAWLRVTNTDQGALALSTGGILQNAAVTLNGTPFLTEQGKLTAALEGEFAYRESVVKISRMLLQSESANLNAEGVAQVQLTTDADHNITGIGNVGVNMRFGVPDLRRIPQAFPGVLPPELQLAGHVVGQFQASGAASDIRVQQGTVQFQGFSAMLGKVPFTIPQGAATFNGNLALNLGAPSTGSPFDAVRLVNVSNGAAALTGAQFKGKPIDQMQASFQLHDGVLDLQSAKLSVGGGSGGSAEAVGRVDFTQPAPAVDIQFAARDIPLSEANSEIENLVQFESGVVNLPAQGQAARVSFSGLTEDEILRTVRMENFNFATGPVALLTGPVLNKELDRARGLMRQEVTESGQARRITLTSVSGTLQAAGDGLIHFSENDPINVVGDNTGDFRLRGTIRADHTMDVRASVVGKLENLIGFTLPNLIPNLRSGSDEDKNRFMAKMNESAAKEHYTIRITGALDNPDLSGIGTLAAQFLKDIFMAAPTQIIGGVVDLGKDAPGALLDAAGAVLNAPGAVVEDPKVILRTPQNIGKGLGRAFGLTKDSK